MFKNAFQCFIRNYFNFSGRATRSEFWCVVPILLLVWLMPQLLMFKLGYIMWLAYLMMIMFFVVPVMSLTVRRLHDAGYSEWRLLVPWIMLPMVLTGIPAFFGTGVNLYIQNAVDLACVMIIAYGVVLTIMPSRK